MHLIQELILGIKFFFFKKKLNEINQKKKNHKVRKKKKGADRPMFLSEQEKRNDNHQVKDLQFKTILLF